MVLGATNMFGTNLVLFEPVGVWTPKLEFPDLSYCKTISIDLETKDPNLEDLGPGSIRRDGYPVGVTIATDSGFKRYYPFAHQAGGNLSQAAIVAWLKDNLKREDLIVVGAHLLYDLEWLRFLGVEVKGKLRDIQIAEALIDEESEHGYSFDAIASKYLGKGKEEVLLKDALATFGYCTTNHSDLWKLHSKYVGEYAEWDGEGTLKVYMKQIPILDAENLWSIFNMECDLIRVLLDMRFQGIRIDVAKCEILGMQLKNQETIALKELRSEVGFQIDVWSPDHLTKVCRKNNWQVPTTEKGNPSYKKLFLRKSDNPFFNKVAAIRNVNRLRTMYVDDLGKFLVNGRIHPSYKQMRDEDGGTRSGRMSGNCPNEQQIPARDTEIAPIIRALRLPEEGEFWNKKDYSQQEPRILVHYAFLRKFDGAAAVRQAYFEDKKMDYYNNVANTAKLKRKPAKDLTLGICYGEGKDKIARDLGMSVEDSEKVKEIFNKANPYVLKIANDAMELANNRGYIRTLLGRRRRFNLWEPVDSWKMKKAGHDVSPVSLTAAQDKWQGVRLKRAYTYKALNGLIQGSAADMTKAAMIQIHRYGKIPLSAVHDELNDSVPNEKVANDLQEIMEHCVDLTVPIYAESTIGPHWK